MLFAVRLLAPLATEAFRFERHLIAGKSPRRAPPVLLARLQAKHLRTQFDKLLFERGEALLDCFRGLSRGGHVGRMHALSLSVNASVAVRRPSSRSVLSIALTAADRFTDRLVKISSGFLPRSKMKAVNQE